MAKTNLYERIPPEELKKGAIYSLVNSYQLYGDALIMNSLGRLPRVYSITKLAFEEASKSLMLFELYLFKKDGLEIFKNSERYKLIVQGLEDHNKKTKFGLNFLLNKHVFNYKGHPAESDKDSTIYKETENLKELLDQIGNLNHKKNTSLYTSLVNGKFLPPQLTITNKEVEEINNRTVQLLIKVKQTIIKDDQAYYTSIGLDFDVIKMLDPFLEARKMGEILTTYLNKKEKMKGYKNTGL